VDYKNNHYVAQMLLKRFKSATGELFYFNKEKPEKGIAHRKTDRIFSGSHIYTAYDKNGKADVTLESEFYKQLDNTTSPIIDKVIAAARAGQLPSLTAVERSLWDKFFAHQWQRTPDFHNKILILKDAKAALHWSIARYEEKYGPVSDEQRLSLLEDVEMERIQQSAKVAALRRDGPRVIGALASRGIAIARISNPDISFVIGSLPIARFQRPGLGLDDESVEAWFPISHDIAVSPRFVSTAEKLVEVGDDHVQIINRQIYRQSTEVAGRSMKQLEALVSLTQTPVVPPDDADR
jgi:hypothetical protein